MHEFHVAEHVMLSIESGIANGTVPLCLPEMHGALMSEQVGAEPKRKPALFAAVRALAIVDCAHMRLEMGLCLELEAAALAGELAHFFMDDLYGGGNRRC